MATVEDQIHRVFIAREEERCRTLEKETGKPVKRREVPKPWTRLGPQALLEDSQLLHYVTEFDYDLADSAFQEYCRERGVLHVAGEPGSSVGCTSRTSRRRRRDSSATRTFEARSRTRASGTSTPRRRWRPDGASSVSAAQYCKTAGSFIAKPQRCQRRAKHLRATQVPPSATRCTRDPGGSCLTAMAGRSLARQAPERGRVAIRRVTPCILRLLIHSRFRLVKRGRARCRRVP